jgi:diguanylate cyclase (GGDEF)-like protein
MQRTRPTKPAHDRVRAVGTVRAVRAPSDAHVRARPRRPMLLILVYGIFLVVVGVTASAQSVVVSAQFSTSVINATVAHDRTTIRAFVEGNLVPADLAPGPIEASRLERLQGQLAYLVDRGEVLRIEIRTPEGAVLMSDTPGLRGTVVAPTIEFQEAVAGAPKVAFASGDAVQTAGPAGLPSAEVLRVYLPIVRDGKTQAVFAVWRDADPILQALDRIRGEIIGLTVVAALVVAGLLFVLFRAAQARISRQTDQIVEATRRDTLTELLNHGAVVASLESRIEAARASEGSLAVAVVDVDNFRLLNEAHGHDAGDQVLREVAAILAETAPADAIVGRYGPDEFLVALASGDVGDLLGIVERMRTRLVGMDLRFGDSERLPTTVSAGICRFPEDGSSLTELLTTAAVTLAEAKSGGGDLVVVARSESTQRTATGAFDVLQGLVFAIDTKDRYTKRHSEEVALYALFLSDRLQLDAEFRRALRLAGLLHDVGKIGIPDAILRKPAKLTDAEYAVVKQHVALGDLIVREVGDAELVRAGVRHHHERWDGRGYLTGLAGDDIPLIGRILAVADAFSAMTSSRPYRKALSVKEALDRLGDAAGTQLDERLVRTFILGIETAEDAPLPGAPVRRSRLWTPEPRVA